MALEVIGFHYASKRIENGREILELRLCDGPEPKEQDWELNFTLLYSGAVPAEGSSSRVKEKHVLRKAFHKQLKELWQVQPTLAKMAKSNVSVPGSAPGEYVTYLEATANRYARCGYRFVPLLTPDQSLSCAIDVLFLRRDHPGGLVSSRGDIDNRLNTIFDALQLPQSKNCDDIRMLRQLSLMKIHFTCSWRTTL
jgi:hypothetical protein